MLFFLMMLTGCKKETYADFIRNPDALNDAIAQCQNAQPAPTNEFTFCDKVKYAADHLSAAIYEQQLNPEQFGARILDAETMLVKLKSENQSSETYQQQLNEVQLLLAVAGINTPG